MQAALWAQIPSPVPAGCCGDVLRTARRSLAAWLNDAKLRYPNRKDRPRSDTTPDDGWLVVPCYRQLAGEKAARSCKCSRADAVVPLLSGLFLQALISWRRRPLATWPLRFVGMGYADAAAR